ncbi:HORMA domain-containing protein [Lipomyces arxii]|uniref:HORMA domain-containing protein n=1 Tax=Lipomyces arxii TaxID=56418 RepID=UPI0034CFBCB0
MAQAFQTTTSTSVNSTVQQFTTLKQSQELLQTFISAAFGCLTFLRGIFSDDNYDEEKFIGSAAPTDSPLNARDYVRIKKLKRGLSDQVDTFLDWIERGIFDALEHKYLRAVLFAIYLDPRHPHDITESYTFNIAYRDDTPEFVITDSTGEPVLPSLGHHQAGGVTNTEARKNLQQMMRRFIMLTQTLPPLPDDRYLTIRLLFDDSCPLDYQPPGFKDAGEERALQFSLQEDEILDRQNAGILNTGWHALSLKIACLPERQPATASSQFQSNQQQQRKRVRVERPNDITQLDPAELNWPVPNPVTNSQSLDQTRQALHQMSQFDDGTQGTETQTVHSLLSATPTGAPNPAAVNGHVTTGQPTSQSTAASTGVRLSPPKKKRTSQLKKKVLREKTANEKNKQVGRDEHELGSQLAKTVSAVQNLTITPLIATTHREQKDPQKRVHRNVLGSTNSFVDTHDKVVIDCDCGRSCDDSMFDLVQCSRCEGWKHLACYGYRSLRDPNLSAVFLCCECKFGRLTPEFTNKIKTLALFRSGFKVFFDRRKRYIAGPLKPDFIEDYCRDMALKPDEVTPIFQLLQAEGALIFHSSKSKHGRKHSAAHIPTLVRSITVRDSIYEKYFDPTENILVVVR